MSQAETEAKAGGMWIPRRWQWRLARGLVALVMLGASIALVEMGESFGARAVGWVGALFFAGTLVGGAVRVWQGEKIGVRLEEEGFVEVRGQEERRVAWEEVVSFRAVKVSALTKVVGYRLWDESKLNGLEKTLKRMYGVDRVLMRALAVESGDLEGMMNQRRAEHGRNGRQATTA